MTLEERAEQLRIKLVNLQAFGRYPLKKIEQAIATALRAVERETWKTASLEVIKDNNPADNNRWAQAERHWHVEFHRRATQEDRYAV